MIESILPLGALIAAAMALAFWLDHRFEALSKVGASLLAILFGALLSNFGIVPAASPLYDGISGIVTSLAIAWLLLSIDLRDVMKAGRPMLGAFGLALIGTAMGAMVGAALFAGFLGDQTAPLAGTLTGTYSGGSLNFIAVATEVGLADSIFAGTVAADNLTTAIWLGVTLSMPLVLRRFYPTPVPSSEIESDGEETVAHPFFGRTPISTMDLAWIAFLGIALVATAEWIGAVVPLVPSVLWLTTLALVVGQLGPTRRLHGGMQLGNVALHLFFVVIGIHSRIEEIVVVGAQIFLYTLVVVAIHGLVVYGVGRWLRFDLGTLSVASQAAVGGPSSALAVAVSRGWRGLILPGVLVGLLGYAVGNYLGLAVHGIVSWFG